MSPIPHKKLPHWVIFPKSVAPPNKAVHLPFWEIVLRGNVRFGLCDLSSVQVLAGPGNLRAMDSRVLR